MKTAILILVVTVLIVTACNNSPQTKTGGQTASNLKFTDATEKSGVKFRHVPTRSENKYMPEIIGSGAVLADFNRDGAPDLVLVNGGTLGAKDRPENARDRLFINNGKGVFTDRTDEWNLTSTGYGMGAAVGDFDNDGFTDLFLTNYDGQNRLLRNTGTKFEDVTEKTGLKSDGKWTTSAGFFDMEGDGNLDLFVVRYVLFSPENAVKTYRNRMQTYPTPLLYEAVADEIWRNTGNGKFVNVSQEAGLTAEPRKGLALAIGDIDKDGDQDVYVANDTDANQLWINDGKGKFKDIAQFAGCAYSEVGKEEGSMGADFSDIDNNNRLDIAVPNFQDETTAVYSQTEPLLFREISDSIGIGQAARARLKFGLDFFDADNDGDEELLVVNGHIDDVIGQNSDSVTFEQLNTLYENLGNGKFTDVSAGAGDALADKQVSRGLVTADLDGDGDLDFVVTNNGGTAQIAFNETAKKGNFVGLWLEGAKTNRSAIGTRVTAKIGDKMVERQIMGAQSYLSVSDFRLLFGLGDAQKIDELTIHWLGSEPQTVKNLEAGKYFYIKQGSEPTAYIAGEKQIP